MFYRKYRPQIIADLDNEVARETLGKSLLTNKFSQAYLLCGPKGIGKTTTARLIAKVLNCSKRSAGDEPCNKCDSCLAITNGKSLDVIEIDAASNTSVEDVRNLRERINLAPANSPFKVYIIDEVHMLSTSAFNALLKTLEEPPKHVVFILATTDPQKLPETVISRCTRFDFSRGTIPEISRAIERAARGEGIKLEAEVTAKIAQMADGSFRDAHKILEQLSSMSAKIALADIDALKPHISRHQTGELLKFLVTRDSPKAFGWLEGYVNQNGQVKILIEELIKLLREEYLISMKLIGGKPEFAVSSGELLVLIRRFEAALSELEVCPVESLPLEIIIAEYSEAQKSNIGEKADATQKAVPETPLSNPTSTPIPVLSRLEERGPVDADNLTEKQWKELLEKLKSYNHNLTAVLRSTKPLKIANGKLSVEVKYKFHLDKLSEPKNISAIEDSLSDIMGKPFTVKFVQEKK